MKPKVALALFHSHSYLEFRKLIADLLLEGKSTGNKQSEELTYNSKLNDIRMNHLDEIITVSEENILKLNSLQKEYIWLVIAEGWCADGAQIIPILNKMAVASQRIDLKIALKSENEDLLNLFVTNGENSIPKVIVIAKQTAAVMGSWGPRPQGAVDLMQNYKIKHGVIDEAAKTDLQMWYLNDKGISIQDELIKLLLG
ncbi:thioredoxin family protein [Flavobacterium cellulosilyticum]|uniref:Thioredoxin family protein n=1 Tax=Flavobacterium cellulosilyticum TaxID=2541731 RepID=A0A4R5CLQ9_9FLAO|nr:thioredoxin family protein [Flavobacterium cellulosilyticum]TDD99333.1 thioredoxin family protein [Flavobacterium cellulosilyticum]